MNFKTMLITGGSGKLGDILTSHFLKLDYRVIVTCYSQKSLNVLMNKHSSYGDKFTAFSVDFIEVDSVSHLIEQLDKQNIKPEILINNARSTRFLEVGDDGLVSRSNFSNEYTMDVIVPYELIIALTRQRDSKLCNVVNIGSQYGTVAANPGLYLNPDTESPVHYSVAKAGISHLTKELAVRLADKKIRVNCIAYGGIEGRVDEAFKLRYSKLTPIGRMLRDADLSGPVELLISDSCSAITGHTLSVDGGWGIW